MALLQATFLSGSLIRKTEVNIIVPADAAFPGMPDNRPYRSMYLLHGYMGSNTDWLLNMPLEELSQRYNLAIIMPSGENSFYTDWQAPGSRYSSFIGRELVAFTRKLLPLDLYIACGWNDMLVNSNRDFARTLKKLGVNHVYEECAGTHEWPLWRDHLIKGLDRLYPAPTELPPMPFWIEKPGDFEY
jgi:S-formylglutathione hydrolase FrmB